MSELKPCPCCAAPGQFTRPSPWRSVENDHPPQVDKKMLFTRGEGGRAYSWVYWWADTGAWIDSDGHEMARLDDYDKFCEWMEVPS